MKNKLFIKMFSVFTVFAMVLTLVTPNIAMAVEPGKPEIKVTVDKEELERTGEFTASVNLDTNNVADINTVQIRLKYDPNVLEVVKKVNGAGVEEDDIVRVLPTQNNEICVYGNDIGASNVNLMLTLNGNTLEYNGVLYTVKFKVKENASLGKSDLTIEYTDTFKPIKEGISNQEIPSTIVNSSIKVVSYLQSISLNKTTGELNVDDTDTLSVTYVPADTTDDKTVTWTSSDASKATVENGVVTAKAPGTVTITADVNGKKASCTYTIKAPLKGISLGQDFEILKGQSKKISVTYNPTDTTDDKTARWNSSDEEVATVDENGNITAKKEGTTTITATVGNYNDTVEVTVTEIPLGSIAITEIIDTIDRGQTHKFGITYNPEDTTDDKTVTWTTSDEEIATIDEDGVLTAKKEGTVDITAKVGEKTDTITVEVKEYHLKGLDLSKNGTKLEEGKEYNIDIGLNPENCTDKIRFEWMTSDESVVELFEDGTYKALKEGKAKITIKAITEYNEEIYASIDVEVAKKGTIDENDENSNKDNEITSPKTGDINIYVVIAMILACGFFAITFKSKKVRRTRRRQN